MATTKQKTWAAIEKEIGDTQCKWQRILRLTIDNPLPARSKGKRNQTDAERTVGVEFRYIAKGAGVVPVQLLVRKHATAIENLQVVAQALETIRLAEYRELDKAVIKLLKQMYPGEFAPAPPPPPPPQIPPHYAALHLAPGAPLAVAEAAYQALARTHHPDAGGSTAAMQALNAAIERIRREAA
jgi:hypothetical protein